MGNEPKIVRCPICKKAFDWHSKPQSRPFCSERCRLIDLGDWLEEKHRIPDNSPANPFLPPEDDHS
jgi:hypothetical protein